MRSINPVFVYKGISDLPPDAFSDFSACFWRRFESDRFADEGFCKELPKQVFRSVEGKARVTVTRFQQTSAEPLACSVRRSMRCSFKISTSRLSGRTSARALTLPSSRATLSGIYTFWRRTPNQALQPTRMLVTFCAFAQPAPSTRVADL